MSRRRAASSSAASDRTAEADYWTHTIGFSGEAAYGFDLGGGTAVLPLGTLDAGWSGHSGFTETGAGALGLMGTSENWTRLDTALGVALAQTSATAASTLTGRALWEHTFADVVPGQSLAFAGFEVRAPAAGSDRLRLVPGSPSLPLKTSPSAPATTEYSPAASAATAAASASV